MTLNGTQDDPKQINGLSEETLKKASLYQVIEELILAEHARFLTEDCGIDLGKPIQVEDPEGKQSGKIRS
jgi:hypothetical protein